MRKSTASYRTYSILVKLQLWFLGLQWKTCLWQNCSLGFCACSEGPALGQNTDDDDTRKHCYPLPLQGCVVTSAICQQITLLRVRRKKSSASMYVRPGADQSSKAAFGKSAFAKTCFLLLKIRHGAHQSSKKQKCFRARFGTF